MHKIVAAVGLLFVALLLPRVSLSSDYPVAARKLVVKAKSGKEKLVLVVKDAAIGFPAIGGSDDPMGVGADVELFAGSGEFGDLVMPSTGWLSKPGTYQFENKGAPLGISPVRKLKLREGRSLKIVSRGAGVVPTGSLGSIALRLTTGTVRTCVLFDASTVVKEDSTRFIAKKALAASLVDCSDEELGIPCQLDPVTFNCVGGCSGAGVCALTDPFSFVCSCVDPTDPCDGTAPVCNGTCPAGEFCAAFGGGSSPGCGCIPDGDPVCGGIPGVCGGSCPTGLACGAVFDLPVFGGGPFCTCGGSGDCGSSGGGLTCPPGFGCGGVPGSGPFCVPIDCPGSTGYPSCGGNCGAGASCNAVSVAGFDTCICSPQATACDASCEGYECGGGQSCILDVGNCMCGAP
ncbi:MAG: hypothetical protein ACI8TX_002992 [Hyphomicrobiaceae bacterium]|jgi:hypothetical protein